MRGLISAVLPILVCTLAGCGSVSIAAPDAVQVIERYSDSQQVITSVVLTNPTDVHDGFTRAMHLADANGLEGTAIWHCPLTQTHTTEYIVRFVAHGRLVLRLVRSNACPDFLNWTVTPSGGSANQRSDPDLRMEGFVLWALQQP
jgi:hypothetical protein